eukprot:gnl/TRDRNA2_/TRDRNA2_136842_c1_seq1.p2 gnl/TRDRNA2_/TRDRNA2_136842_c1~~gnl/TRDRNA2_/TRDRNA2_136842_c1_seq1.p2  ORF type:complete len:124 (-),score=1.87 gnl/TRDRNA2_/TRDRNA2_136842_c1_seq1:722-1093(-)
MKNLIFAFALFLTISPVLSQERPESRTKKMIAQFSGSATDGYYFTNNVNSDEIKFQITNEELLDHYNLNESEFIGKFFRITYRIDFIPNKDYGDSINRGKVARPFHRSNIIIDMELLDDFEEE